MQLQPVLKALQALLLGQQFGTGHAGFFAGVLLRWPVLLLAQWSQLNVDPWVALPAARDSLALSIASRTP